MPQKDTTMSRCQPSQRGWIRNRHTGPERAGAAVSAGVGRAAGRPRPGAAFSMP